MNKPKEKKELLRQNLGKYGWDLHGHMLEHSIKLLHEVNLVLTSKKQIRD